MSLPGNLLIGVVKKCLGRTSGDRETSRKKKKGDPERKQEVQDRKEVMPHDRT